MYDMHNIIVYIFCAVWSLTTLLSFFDFFLTLLICTLLLLLPFFNSKLFFVGYWSIVINKPLIDLPLLTILSIFWLFHIFFTGKLALKKIDLLILSMCTCMIIYFSIDFTPTLRVEQRPLSNVNFILAYLIFTNLSTMRFSGVQVVLTTLIVIIIFSLIGTLYVKLYHFEIYWESFSRYQGVSESIDAFRFAPIYKEINYYGITPLFLIYIMARYSNIRNAILPFFLLLGTLSRTSIVLGIAGMASAQRSVRNLWWIGFLTMLIISFGIFVFPAELTDRFIGIVLHATESGFSGRTVRWTTAVEIFYMQPFFGIGYYEVMNFGPAYDAAHNTILEIAAGKGMFGVLIWCFIWCLIMYRLGEMAFILLFIMITNSFFISVSDYTELWRPFIFLIFLNKLKRES